MLAGIPAHAVLPLALLLVAGSALAASVVFRLDRVAQRRAGWLAVAAPLLPAVGPHLAQDDVDLTAVSVTSILLLVAVMHAQRTRVAQLGLRWRQQVDGAEGRQVLRQPGPGAAGPDGVYEW